MIQLEVSVLIRKVKADAMHISTPAKTRTLVGVLPSQWV